MNNIHAIELSEAMSQEACLEALLGILKASLSEEMWGELREAVYLREDTSSTYLGNGLAVPHGRVASLGSAHIVFGISRYGVDWPSGDSKANLVALVGVDKKDVAKYLSILQKISKWRKFNPAIFDSHDFDSIKNSIISYFQ